MNPSLSDYMRLSRDSNVQSVVEVTFYLLPQASFIRGSPTKSGGLSEWVVFKDMNEKMATVCLVKNLILTSLARFE